jgi:hypothetical protein
VHILLINLGVQLPDAQPVHPSCQLARLWTELGHQVTFIASQSPSAPIEITEAGVRCFLLPSSIPTESKPLSDTKLVLNFLASRQRLRSALNLLGPRPALDAIVAATNDQSDNYAAARFSRATGAPFIRQTDLLLSLTLADLAQSSGAKLPELFITFLRRAERYAYRNASMVVTSLPNSFPHMQSLDLDRERWLYLPQSNTDLRAQAPLYLRIFQECQKGSLTRTSTHATTG